MVWYAWDVCTVEPELMYLMADRIIIGLQELLDWAAPEMWRRLPSREVVRTAYHPGPRAPDAAS